MVRRIQNMKFWMICMLCFTFVFITACVPNNAQSSSNKNKTIILADADWDSIKFHNAVAAFIMEKGYGYKADVIGGSTAITFTGLRKGDIDAYMEVWSDNLDFYGEALESGDVIEVSTNFDDNAQGLYVPTYVIKGDEARGIKPIAPNLKTVKDLAQYKDLFKDPEEPSKGRIYGGIAGWQIDEILYKKYVAYGLDKNFNYMRPGSEGALSASVASAYDKGEPWVGYYWEPTWITGKYDLTLLEDEPYSKEKWEKGECASPPTKVTVCVNKNMKTNAPELVEFLSRYKTSSALTASALAYMMDQKANHEETAKWFLQENKDVWKSWVPEDIAAKVEAAL